MNKKTAKKKVKTTVKAKKKVKPPKKKAAGRPMGTTKGKRRTEKSVTTHMPKILRDAIDEAVKNSPLDLTDWCRQAFILKLPALSQARVRRALMTTIEAFHEIISARDAPLSQAQVAARIKKNYGERKFSEEYLRRTLDLLVTEGRATRTKGNYRTYKWMAA